MYSAIKMPALRHSINSYYTYCIFIISLTITLILLITIQGRYVKKLLFAYCYIHSPFLLVMKCGLLAQHIDRGKDCTSQSALHQVLAK